MKLKFGDILSRGFDVSPYVFYIIKCHQSKIIIKSSRTMGLRPRPKTLSGKCS